MQSFPRQLKRVGLACVAVGSIFGSQSALALGTASTTQINNTATVNYSVQGVSQAAVNSNQAQFVVDNKVNLTLTRVGLAQTPVAAGQANQTVVYRLENIGNTSQGYSFLTANLTGDNFDMTNFRVRVSADPCTLASTTPPVAGYAPATDTADFVQTLAADACRWVYIVADTPAGRVNGDLANVTLRATTAIAGAATAAAAAAAPQTQTAGADTAGVDTVFADTGRDGHETAQGTYVVATAALAVQKSSSVVWDPFNLFTNPKAIPQAIMEYAIQLTNTGGADATVVSITDAVPANTTFTASQYNGNASDVSITVGAGAPTFCVAEAGGSDTNADGCFRTSANGTLTVQAPAITSVAQGGAATRVTVRFRVTIQ